MHNQNTFVHTLRNHHQSHCDQLTFATFISGSLSIWLAIVYDMLTEIFRPMISKRCTDCLDYPEIFLAECIRHVLLLKKNTEPKSGVLTNYTNYRDWIVQDSNLPYMVCCSSNWAIRLLTEMGIEPMTRKLLVTSHLTRQNTILIALWSHTETLNYGLVQIVKRLLQHITAKYLKNNFLFLYHHWRCKGKSTIRSLFA